MMRHYGEKVRRGRRQRIGPAQGDCAGPRWASHRAVRIHVTQRLDNRASLAAWRLTVRLVSDS